MKRVVGVHAHRAELQHREGLRVLADPRLPEEDGPGRLQLHQRGNQQEQRRQQDDSSVALPSTSHTRLIHS